MRHGHPQRLGLRRRRLLRGEGRGAPQRRAAGAALLSGGWKGAGAGAGAGAPRARLVLLLRREERERPERALELGERGVELVDRRAVLADDPEDADAHAAGADLVEVVEEALDDRLAEGGVGLGNLADEEGHVERGGGVAVREEVLRAERRWGVTGGALERGEGKE